MKSYNTPALPHFLYGSENLTIKARDARRVTEAEMKYTRKTAECTWTDYKTKHRKKKRINPSFGQNTGLQKTMAATCKQNAS